MAFCALATPPFVDTGGLVALRREGGFAVDGMLGTTAV